MFRKIIALEDSMDRAGCLEKHWNDLSELRTLVEASLRDDWEVVYAEATRVLESPADPSLKAFALQWAVIATEVEFDLEKRRRWLSRWNEVHASGNGFCRYLRAYQHSLSAFFDGALREAEGRFKQSYEFAVQLGYPRGEMRCLFHLGLVQRDLGQNGAALEYLFRALAIARTRKDRSYGKRIQTQIDRVSGLAKKGSGEFSFANARLEIERLIATRDFDRARSALVEAEIRRRKVKQGRKRESFHVYLPLIRAGRGCASLQTCWERMARQNDPILKIRMAELWKAAFTLTEGQSQELADLKSIHGVANVITRSSLSSDEVEICGISLSSLLDADIQVFMRLLLSAESPVGKEQICKALWGFVYDPTSHDGRIYKLVHKTRAFFKKPDLLVNTYGGYQINPKFKPKKEPVISEAS